VANQEVINKREGETPLPERTRGGRVYTPSVDIIEDAEELLLLADVPGATADSIDIRFEQGELSIHARVEPRQPADTTRYLLREYGVGDYHRVFRIGETIDSGKIGAEVNNGVLKVHLPKAEAVKPRKIAVKTA